MKILVFQTPTCNISNVLRALNYLEFDVGTATTSNNLEEYDVLIIPGVGNYGYVMSQAARTDLIEIISHFIKNEKLVIGICLGFQLLFNSSDEAPNVNGVGILKGHFELLPTHCEMKPPKIGFSETLIETNYGDVIGKYDFYYLHKYALLSTPEQYDSIGYSKFNGMKYISFFKKNNIVGCQFHPELSSNVGLTFLKDIITGPY